MNTDQFYTFLSTTGVEIAIKVLAALAFWAIGRWLIARVAGANGWPVPAPMHIHKNI